MTNLRWTNLASDLASAFSVLRDMSADYPGFDAWYRKRVVPQVLSGVGHLLLAERDGRLRGVAIGKSGAETKLQCIRVLPEHRHDDVGGYLMDAMLRRLDCDRPFVTVGEANLHACSRMFVNRYGFRLDEVWRGTYREGRLEYAFNVPTFGERRSPK